MTIKIKYSVLKKYPERETAHQHVRAALKSGALSKEACSVCGDLQTEAHHNNYTKTLSVVWLCKAHHLERHHQTG